MSKLTKERLDKLKQSVGNGPGSNTLRDLLDTIDALESEQSTRIAEAKNEVHQFYQTGKVYTEWREKIDALYGEKINELRAELTASEERVKSLEEASRKIDLMAREIAEKVVLSKELAHFCLQSFSLQESGHPDAVRIRDICYTILDVQGHDAKPLPGQPAGTHVTLHCNNNHNDLGPCRLPIGHGGPHQHGAAGTQEKPQVIKVPSHKYGGSNGPNWRKP